MIHSMNRNQKNSLEENSEEDISDSVNDIEGGHQNGNINTETWNLDIKNEEKFWIFLKKNGFTYEPYYMPKLSNLNYGIKKLY